MYKPSVIIADFETALTDGSPSVEYYRHDFRAVSCAFAWRGKEGELKTHCTWGEEDTRAYLEKIQRSEIPVVCHNLPFDYGVAKCRFPGLESIFQICTMRLTQMTDNGGPEHLDHEETWEDALLDLEGKKPFNGLSLQAAVSRFCGTEYFKHKQPYLDLMIQRGGGKADFHLLTQEELTEYNVKDAEVTLVLYENLTKILKDRSIDWTRDHVLYRSRSELTVAAKIRGVKVDSAQVNDHIELKKSNLDTIVCNFREALKPHIERIEQRKLDAYIGEYKSKAGRDRAQARIDAGSEPLVKFNLSSNKDKTALFVEELGLTPKFFTPTGEPSFGAKLLWQWGASGLLLKDLGKERISLNQVETLKELSSYDGRWHLDMKVVGARSGRLAGGSNA